MTDKLEKTEKKEYSFEEKMLILKKQTTNYDPSAKQIINEWEDQMSRLKLQLEWVNHPDTQKLRKLAQDQLEAIVSELSNNDALTETERLAYFKLKDAHFAYLAVLTIDPEAEMQIIDEAVEQELV